MVRTMLVFPDLDFSRLYLDDLLLTSAQLQRAILGTRLNADMILYQHLPNPNIRLCDIKRL